MAVLWAVIVGAGLKFVLTEGLTRWQLATGQTLLEGVVRYLGRPVSYLFLVYLLIWSAAVGRALASACGVTAHALFPVFADAMVGQVVFGTAHSLLGIGLVIVGGYRLFERMMSLCIVMMFGTVMLTAARLRPDLSAIIAGLVPSIPSVDVGLVWTVALLGGVGGTVTLLCYGYWIREEGREGPKALSLCRWDLASGYVATALFGVAMVIIGSTVEVEGGGATLLVTLADQLDASLGSTARWVFLVGAWGAVVSSLLGVWQSVPYLFADLWYLLRGSQGAEHDPVDTRGLSYRGYLLALGLVSIAGLYSSFLQIQKIYAVLGAMFIPMLALVLLRLNGRQDLVGAELRNHAWSRIALWATLAMFLAFGYVEFRKYSG